MIMFIIVCACLQAQMKPLLGKVNRKKPPAPPVEVEESSTASSDAHKKEEAPALPSPQTEAVRAEQTTAIAPSVFYKSSTYLQLNSKPRSFRCLNLCLEAQHLGSRTKAKDVQSHTAHLWEKTINCSLLNLTVLLEMGKYTCFRLSPLCF